jgi:Na+/H+-dicarboxylate symporter
VPPVPAPAAAKPARNWLAVGALAVSLGSWAVYPVILGGLAVVIGIASLLWARKRRMNIPVTAILAIIIGLAAIIINIFWLDIFPPPEVLPPVR